MVAFSCSISTRGACMGPAAAGAADAENAPAALRRQPVSPAIAGCAQRRMHQRNWPGISACRVQAAPLGLQRQPVAVVNTEGAATRNVCLAGYGSMHGAMELACFWLPPLSV